MSADWVPSLWLDTFVEMLNEDNELDYDDNWTLNFNYSQTDTVTKEDRRRGMKIYSHCAFGDFECESCLKTWSSAKVVVLFRYRLRSDADRGTVTMRPFGQACRRCQNDQYYLPGFTQDKVESALGKLFAKIRKNCYGEEDDEEQDSGSGDFEKKTKPHEKSLCEACKMGICCQD
ncbi:receptor-transporting protein 3-like [Genypterus blacodes]|uniref:receptor-transporting protein 3-like n=1 Tax=Genypterus blacodes TaxID=154954 RepID=UPI003F77378B